MKRVLLLLCLMIGFASTAHASPYLLYSIEKVGNVHSVFVDTSGIAYLACEYGGLKIYDTKAESGPSQIGGWDMKVEGKNAPTREMLLVDNVLIVAQREGGTRFLDVSDPANPQLITTIDNPISPSISKSSRLAIEGDTLYVSSVMGGFSRVDISDVRNPKVLDTITFTNAGGMTIESQGIHIDGDYAYVATPWAGWSIVDISNTASMEIVNSIAKPAGIVHGVWDVHVENGIVYALAQGYGIQIFDARDVNNVTLLSEVLLPLPEGYGPDTPPADIKFLVGSIAAISYGSLGVYIYDFSDLTNAVLLGTLTAEGMVAVNMFLSGTELFVGGFNGGLFVFDVSGFMQTPVPATLLLTATGVAALLNRKRKSA